MLNEGSVSGEISVEVEDAAFRYDVNSGWVHPEFPQVEFSHKESHKFAYVGEPDQIQILSSEQRSRREYFTSPGATPGTGVGNRPKNEDADPTRTRFEVDHDRILWSENFRLLGDKAQAITYMSNPNVRNRATHCTEVSQIAQRIAASLGLQDSFAKAAGLGHDIGHSCCGHQGEDALNQFSLDYGGDGFDHATHGASICKDLNLNLETIDAVGHHSWKCDSPLTPEASVVAMADRIAYLSADMDDAIRVGILKPQDFPKELKDTIGLRLGQQIDYFIKGVQSGTLATGRVSMLKEHAEVMRAFRAFNYETIYMRPFSEARAKTIYKIVYSLCEKYTQDPSLLAKEKIIPNSRAAVQHTVKSVASFTDSRLLLEAEKVLGLNASKLDI